MSHAIGASALHYLPLLLTVTRFLLKKAMLSPFPVNVQLAPVLLQTQCSLLLPSLTVDNGVCLK